MMERRKDEKWLYKLFLIFVWIIHFFFKKKSFKLLIEFYLKRSNLNADNFNYEYFAVFQWTRVFP